MRTAIKILTTAAKVLGGIVAVAPAIQPSLPPDFIWWGIGIFGGASILKDTVVSVVDLLDDGQRNQSFQG